MNVIKVDALGVTRDTLSLPLQENSEGPKSYFQHTTPDSFLVHFCNIHNDIVFHN